MLPDDHNYERLIYDAVLALSTAGNTIPVDVLVINQAQKQAPPSVLIEDALREGRP